MGGCHLIRVGRDMIEEIIDELEASADKKDEVFKKTFKVSRESPCHTDDSEVLCPPHVMCAAHLELVRKKCPQAWPMVAHQQAEGVIVTPPSTDSCNFDGPEARLFGYQSRVELETLRTFLRNNGDFYLSPSVSILHPHLLLNHEAIHSKCSLSEPDIQNTEAFWI